jgi:alpha-N-arabinofuranosidase
MFMAGNVFLNGAKAGRDGQSTLVAAEFDPAISLLEKNNGFYLHITLDKKWSQKQSRRLVTTELLGRARIPDLPYEQPDGSPYRIDDDYFGKERNHKNPFPGPFEPARDGNLTLKVWPVLVPR